MALRFRRSIKIAPGVKLNIGKKSIGLSAGVKGFNVGVNSRKGVYSSTGIPGTGLYMQHYHGSGGKAVRGQSLAQPATTAPVGLPVPKEIKPPTTLITLWSIVTIFTVLAESPIGLLLLAGLIYYTYRLRKSEKWAAWKLFSEASTAYKSKKHAEAASKLEQVLEMYPTIRSLDLTLGDLYKNQGENRKAAEIYKRHLSGHPEDLNVQLKLADALFYSEEFKATIEVLQALPRELKERIQIINALGACYLELKQYELAESILTTGPTRKRNMDHDMLIFRYLLGVTYQELGQKKKSITQLQKVYAFDSKYQDVADRLEALGGLSSEPSAE